MSAKVIATMQSGATQQFEADLKVATRSEMKILLAGGLLPEALSEALVRMPKNSD